jgi:transglutaminase-like putative cysteine protease
VRAVPWRSAAGAGIATLLASAPLGAIIQGWTWLGEAALAALVVVALGLALHRLGPFVVVAGQCLGLLVLLAVRFADTPLPGPTAFARFAALATGAGTQIATGIAPAPATPEILFLVTVAFGAVLVAVYGAAVLARAPAAAGVPLLAVFAVPAALDDSLLPWQAVVSAAAGFGVLLVLREGARSQRLGGVVLVAVAVVAALGVGVAGTFVGTAGRFSGAGAGGSGAIGLSPFTTLRGQLTQERPTELFEVRGLSQPAYMRALTLSTYVPDVGWQATRPGPGPNLPGTLNVVAGEAVQIATVDVRNVGFKDYWLPLYGQPISVAGLSGRWTYDERTGTAYTARPRAEDGWQQMADFAVPTAGQLREARGSTGPVAPYLDTTGIDRRVIDLANQVTGRAGTPFDKAIALQDFFTGPSSGFQYSLQTAPGNGDDALVEFLTQGKTGYCEQFAAAMAVMLRAVGVPSRVAVGFTGGTPDGDHRSISTSDAHAWVEAWFPGRGWLILDPTPLTDGRTIVPPYVAEAQAEQAAAAGAPVGAEAAEEPRQEPTPQAAPTPEPTAPDVPVPAAPGAELPLWPLVLGAIVVLLAGGVLTPALLRARARKQRLAAVATGGPGAATAGWAELIAESTDRGVPAKESDTVRAAARRLVREHHLDGAAQQHLRQVVGVVEASWYGGSDPAAGALGEPLAAVVAALATASPLSVRDRLLPRSVLHRARRRPVQHDDAAAPDGRGGGVDDVKERSGAIPARTGGGSAPPSGR